jgi:hypothetical protein
MNVKRIAMREITTVGDLIEQLEKYDREIPVVYASESQDLFAIECGTLSCGRDYCSISVVLETVVRPKAIR